MKAKNNSHPPTRRLVSKGIFPIILFIILLTCMIATKIHAAPLETFLLFYSNNIQGETEACG
jgi:hypothetical protein